MYSLLKVIFWQARHDAEKKNDKGPVHEFQIDDAKPFVSIGTPEYLL